MQDIGSRLASLPMFESKMDGDKLVLLNVESRDIQKRPYIFSIITLAKDGIEVQYSVAPDTSEKLRRLKMLGLVLNIASLISDIYTVDNKVFFQYVDSSIDEAIGSISQNYSALFNKYDFIFNAYRETKRQNTELLAANRTLAMQTSQIREENDNLKSRLQELEKYSDNALMAMIEDWIEAHDGTIDIDEFSKLRQVSPTRIEQILNKMVSLGYIETKG
jgi:hypothetical protein